MGQFLYSFKGSKSRTNLVTFATPDFLPAASLLCKRAQSLGFKTAQHFNKGDLDVGFLQQNASIFSKPRGAGYWLWKPWLVLNKTKKLGENDFLLYLDAGALPRVKHNYFDEIANDGKIHVWLTNGGIIQTNRMFTDKYVWEKVVGCELGLEKNQVWAGAILCSNNVSNITILNEWLKLCSNPDLLCPDDRPDYAYSQGQIGHRHDQSLLNCLIQKSPDSFKVHCDPSVFVIHRQSWIRNSFDLNFFLLSRYLYRKLLNWLPDEIRAQILVLITKHKKPWISNSELMNHLKYWKDRSK